MDKEELYREVFSRLHTSVNEEEIIMKQQKKIRKPKIMAIAIAAALCLALGVGVAAAYNSSRVQDLVLRSTEPEVVNTAAEESGPAPVVETEEPQSVSYDPMPDGRDMISLQGFAGSPEYQAALEWAEFEHGYDRDGAVLQQVGNNPTPWDEKYNYNGYLVYSQEMADKMDEIVEKYGLALHTGGTQGADMDELRALYGNFTSTNRWGGYYHADGTFQFDGEQYVEGFPYVDFQFRRTMKGVLDTVYLNITNAEQYEQWEYQTACGETVLLALGPEKALILAELDDCFVAVNVLAGAETDNGDILSPQKFSAAHLEALADSFDFTVL